MHWGLESAGSRGSVCEEVRLRENVMFALGDGLNGALSTLFSPTMARLDVDRGGRWDVNIGRVLPSAGARAKEGDGNDSRQWRRRGFSIFRAFSTCLLTFFS